MKKTNRITKEEFEELQKEFERVDGELNALRRHRNSLKKKLDWYKYYEKHQEITPHTEGLAYRLFGKSMKDFTPDELREYNRISARKSRQKLKESAKLDKKD